MDPRPPSARQQAAGHARRQAWSQPALARYGMWAVVLTWLVLVVSVGAWISQRERQAWLHSLAASADHEAQTTARILDRLFIEMHSVANMVARQSEVVQLAGRYRLDPPEHALLSRAQRAAQLELDPLVMSVGNYMGGLSHDLQYARIYLNNLSANTITASNWGESDSIVGMVYSDRPYLQDALRFGNGHSFGVARLNQSLSYFVASRIEDRSGKAQGTVTVKFDAPEMALYLSGQHLALIVNAQGRIITTSHAPWMLRNAAALLPPTTVVPPHSDEPVGQALAIEAMAPTTAPDQWLLQGRPYLLRQQPLTAADYQLLILASMEPLAPIVRRHQLMAALVAAVGVAVIVLLGNTMQHLVARTQMEHDAANLDALTGLPNRRAVMAQLQRLFVQAQRTQQWVMVIFVDLDGFKRINDTYGHEVGDQFLVEVGRRMAAGLRSSDMLGRLGGDEFVIVGSIMPVPAQVAPEATSAAASPTSALQSRDEAIHQRLDRLLCGTYDFPSCSFYYPGASFGVVSVAPQASDPDSALKAADQRMYANKQARRQQAAAAGSAHT